MLHNQIEMVKAKLSSLYKNEKIDPPTDDFLGRAKRTALESLSTWKDFEKYINDKEQREDMTWLREGIKKALACVNDKNNQLEAVFDLIRNGQQIQPIGIFFRLLSSLYKYYENKEIEELREHLNFISEHTDRLITKLKDAQEDTHHTGYGLLPRFFNTAQSPDQEFKKLLVKARGLVGELYPKESTSHEASYARSLLEKFNDSSLNKDELTKWVKQLEYRKKSKEKSFVAHSQPGPR